jgi:hypothetical protein
MTTRPLAVPLERRNRTYFFVFRGWDICSPKEYKCTISRRAILHTGWDFYHKRSRAVGATADLYVYKGRSRNSTATLSCQPARRLCDSLPKLRVRLTNTQPQSRCPSDPDNGILNLAKQHRITSTLTAPSFGLHFPSDVCEPTAAASVLNTATRDPGPRISTFPHSGSVAFEPAASVHMAESSQLSCHPSPCETRHSFQQHRVDVYKIGPTKGQTKLQCAICRKDPGLKAGARRSEIQREAKIWLSRQDSGTFGCLGL